MASPIFVTAPPNKIIDQGWAQHRESVSAWFDGTIVVISGVGPFAVSSTESGSGAWMSQSLGWLGTRSLLRICMPGSHNSGVTKSSAIVPSPAILLSAIVCQNGSIYDQLRCGVGCSDIRPACSNKRGFHAGHYLVDRQLGRGGQSIDDIVNNLSGFLRYNPDLVILPISHDYDMENDYNSF